MGIISSGFWKMMRKAQPMINRCEYLFNRKSHRVVSYFVLMR